MLMLRWAIEVSATTARCRRGGADRGVNDGARTARTDDGHERQSGEGGTRTRLLHPILQLADWTVLDWTLL